MFYQDLFRWLTAWGRSRRWGRLVLWGAFPGLFFLLAIVLVIYGATLSRQQLASLYLPLVKSAEVKLEALQNPSAAADPENLSPEGEGAPNTTENGEEASLELDENGAPLPARHILVPLLRIKQLGNSNARVTYLVASHLASQGRTAMAVKLLREIAPIGGGGFALAHAYLGDYALVSRQATEAQAEIVLEDYAAADRGGVKLKLPQVRILASLLEKFGRKDEATRVREAHAEEYPALLGDIVQTNANEGNNARTALDAGRAVFEEKRKTNTLTFEDLNEWVRLELLDRQFDTALQLAEQGSRFSDQQNAAVRLLATVLLYKHQAVSEQWEVDKARAKALRTPPPVLDLQYLDRAARIDSSHPGVSQELARVMALGQGLTEELKNTLEHSLVDGTATGVTHLILANGKLMGEKPQSALPQLRLALKMMPNSHVVMNNLAYAILKYDPKKLPEAKQLIERALQIPGATAAEQASMLDTLADIRLVEDDLLGAIESFENAIKLDGSKLATRRKLAETYTQAGMPELAQGQLAKVKELSQE